MRFLSRHVGVPLIWSLCALTVTTVVAQTVAPSIPGDAGGIVGQAGQVTLVGALALAVVVLWRTHVADSAATKDSVKTTTAALLTTAESNERVAAAVEKMEAAVDRMEAAAHKG